MIRRIQACWCDAGTAKDGEALAFPHDFTNLAVSSEIAEREHSRFGVDYEPKLQADATFEQTVAEAADAEARMEMRSAESVADGGNDLAGLLSLSLRKGAEGRLQLRRQLNPQYPLRCRH